MQVLAFGSYDTRVHPRVGVLLDGLRHHGDTVDEVVVPLGLDTAARVAMLSRPWQLPLLAARIARCWLLLAVRARRQVRRRRPDAIVVGYLGHFDVLLARRLFPQIPIVLDHLLFAADTAADRGAGGGRKQQALRRLDSAAVHSADLVVLDTVEHADLLPAEVADRALVVPVGAPPAWFAAGDARHTLPTVPGTPAGPGAPEGGPRLTVVFFGLFTPLQGTTVIARALATLADDPGITVRMIGTGQEWATARRTAGANPSVIWQDWVPAEELPALVAGHDVCLGIFGTGPKALRVVPNKVFQGAAAGCALVTSDTAPQRTALADAARFVPAGDPAALVEALRELAADPDLLAGYRTAARDRARRSFTPQAVVAPLRERLLALVPAPEESRS